MSEIFRQGPIEIRPGRWQDVLADVSECDAVIVDRPYSSRVHEGQRTTIPTKGGTAGGDKCSINYEPTDVATTEDFMRAWLPRTRWWAIMFSDHQAQRWYEDAAGDLGWYVFAPVPWIRGNPTPRLSGDGPTSAADYITVARPRHRMPKERMGSRPGYYITNGSLAHQNEIPGGKPLALMRALVSHYTRPGDLVVDPCAGGATTLIAAAIEGRRAIGAECDPETFAKAVTRIKRGWTPDLFAGTG